MVILVGKALQIQLLDSTYAKRAENTAIAQLTVYPPRGLIYDRNGKLLINNNPVFDLLATYNQVDPDMDTTKFCQLLGITKEEFVKRLNKNWRDIRYDKSKPFVFLSTISNATFMAFHESMYEFPGFSVQPRSIRGYPQPYASHVLGFIREVDQNEIDDSEGAYSLGDYIGATGIEQAYERDLKGKKGVRFVLKDNLGQIISSYKEGARDAPAVPGKDLMTTIDLALQEYAELLMHSKIGSIVAIEPETGEILAMVSAPSYDPNLLTINRNRGEAVRYLSQDSLKPFFNRGVMAKYPPGSIFKPLVGLIAMQEGVLDPDYYHFCPGYYAYNSFTWGCRAHPPTTNVSKAIQFSCNSYFFHSFRRIVDKGGFYNPEIGLDTFVNYLHKFGLGNQLGLDFPGESSGNVPDSKYYDDLYDGIWYSPTIISLGIGQGEMQLTTMQMANLAAILANRGRYRTPHLGKFFIGDQTLRIRDFDEIKTVGIDSVHFQPIIDGMAAVVSAGTGRGAYVPGVEVAGKTGTVQNPQGQDHSTFIAFAPLDKPKIAIAVYVENAGGGGRFAAPIAGLVIDKYLNGEVHPQKKYLEKYILDSDLVGKP
jgi:penicillin-binding protein 2